MSKRIFKAMMAVTLTTLLVCMVTALALGITLWQFQKGETDDDAKTDFRTAQNT